MLFGSQRPAKLAQGLEKAIPAFAARIEIPLDRGLFHRILCPEGEAVDLCLPRKDFLRFVRQLEYGIGLPVTEEVAIRDEAVQRTLDMAQLLKILFATRNELAKAEGKSRNSIFTDEQLQEMAFWRPKTKLELKRIRGIGPKKAERYGETIVKCIWGDRI